MFIMSKIFIGKDLIKKCQEIHQKSRDAQSCLKWKIRFTKNGKFGQCEYPTLRLALSKLKPQFKNLHGPKESMYFKLQNHVNNSSIGSKLREL